MSANYSVTNSFRNNFLLFEIIPEDAPNINWMVYMMIIELTKKLINRKTDKNNPGDRVRKYLPFAFDYFSTFQKETSMPCYVFYTINSQEE